MNDYFSNLGFNKLQQKQTLYKKVEKTADFICRAFKQHFIKLRLKNVYKTLMLNLFFAYVKFTLKR